jgi:hypothetical protein
MEIKNRCTNEAIFSAEVATMRELVGMAAAQKANLSDANLRGANLCDANLRGANLCHANLRDANLCDAELSHANLSYANLSGANLRGANLRGAELCDANLCYANLCGANLSGANVDFSVWPLWCGSLNVKIDAKQAAQLAYHTFRAMQSITDDADIAELVKSAPFRKVVGKFHRFEECGGFNEKQD